MKRILFILAALAASAVVAHAQTRYLVDIASPVNSYAYKAYKGAARMNLTGGLDWRNGFTVGSTLAPYKPGHATFRLGGGYDTIMFVLGRIYDPESFDNEPAVVTVYADGKKIADEIVRKYDVPRRMTLDITGVDELEFSIVKGEDAIGFAEATLWKAGENPVETGNVISEPPVKTQLVKDLKPYAQYNHFCVAPDLEYKTVYVNGNKYHYGVVCNMEMAFIGVQPGASYFNLRGQYEKLSLLAGPVDNDKSSGGKGWITIKADGKIIHEYEISQTDIAKRIVLDVKGCSQLSIHTEQSDQSMYAAIVDAVLYPEGVFDPEQDGLPADDINPKLRALPDVCKLVSNIPPYAVGGQIAHQVYDGKSDHITFSMGGTKFSEGFVLFEKADFWNDNIVSYAVFDLGNQFDYVSFTAGYVGKSWAMTNDVIRVYADDRLILEAPMMATYPNQDFILPIGKCRKLRFENGGSGNLNVGAYGIADVVVYRGEPVENDLFVHPVPECPYETDLIDLGAPYIHYVSTKADARDQIFYDGSTQRRYFEMPDGSRINKGFMLQTSVHFSLDHGVLSGTDNAAAGAIGGAAVGSAFVAAGAAVGGAVVGSTLIGAAAFLMLLFRPLWLFDVGFQLSFAAVAGIALFMPVFFPRMEEHRRLGLHSVGQLVGVSLAAQLGVAPLVAYHFGNFSVYFLLTNLLVIPLTMIILCLSLLWWVLYGFSIPLQWVDSLLQGMLWALNAAVSWVSRLPGASVDVSFNGYDLAYYYVLLLGLLACYHFRSWRTVYRLLGCLCACLAAELIFAWW